LVWAVLLALYGLLAMLPADSSGGDTYVTLAGHEFDAKVVGTIALSLAILTMLAARAVLKRRIARPS